MTEVGLDVVVAIGAVRALDLKVSLRPIAPGWVKYVKVGRTRISERKSR